jgi:hypothetical protein
MSPAAPRIESRSASPPFAMSRYSVLRKASVYSPLLLLFSSVAEKPLA